MSQGSEYFNFEDKGDERTFKFDIASDELKEELQEPIMQILEQLDKWNNKDLLKAMLVLCISVTIQVFLHSRNPKGAACALWALRGIANNFNEFSHFYECSNVAAKSSSDILSKFLRLKMIEIYEYGGEEHFIAAVKQWSEKAQKKGSFKKKGPSSFDYKNTWGI